MARLRSCRTEYAKMWPEYTRFAARCQQIKIKTGSGQLFGLQCGDKGQFKVEATAMARRRLIAHIALHLTDQAAADRQADAAEAAFRRIVALGLATNALSVKFLFRPSSTDFLPDPTISAPYALWLRGASDLASWFLGQGSGCRGSPCGAYLYASEWSRPA